jgi:acyl-CoA synthetase (AMP-forming)/AMP-acid ligase II
VDTVDLEELAASSRAVAPAAGRPAKRVVSCGTPCNGVEICIGHPGKRMPERRVGELWVRGAELTDGYVNASSEGLFEGAWARTGDLGYLAEGELFVTGRSKEVIVRFGKKYHPEDIEQAVQRATGLTPGSCVAFSPLEGGHGELVVVVEGRTGQDDLAAVAAGAVLNAIGLAPSEVLVVPPGTIPRTPNGKLQRGQARQMHSRGEFARTAAGVAS